MAKPKLDSAGISLFCESVAMMLAAGIQTDEAVGMLSEDIGDVALQATCESVYGRLCAGDTLAVAMKASGAFPRYAVDMVGVARPRAAWRKCCAPSASTTTRRTASSRRFARRWAIRRRFCAS